MFRPLAVLLIGLTLFSTAALAGDGFWQTPTIHDAGKIHPMPNAAYQPDRNATYKLVFSLTRPSGKPGDVNPSLEHVARVVNLYVNAGVPLSHLKIVAVAAGPATALALNDEQYRKLYKVANPNLPVIAQLRKAGVDVAVCAQAMAENHFDYSWKDAQVTLALSALTTLADLQQQGYALMPY
ncbi:MAG: DsrE family protein [Rhodanobacter sp.]